MAPNEIELDSIFHHGIRQSLRSSQCLSPVCQLTNYEHFCVSNYVFCTRGTILHFI